MLFNGGTLNKYIFNLSPNFPPVFFYSFPFLFYHIFYEEYLNETPPKRSTDFF